MTAPDWHCRQLPGAHVICEREDLNNRLAAAAAELRAVHRPGPGDRLCVTCGAADGSWPCVSAQVADDLDGGAR